MAEKKGKSISEENLEKASGGRVDEEYLGKREFRPNEKTSTAYDIYRDSDNKLMGRVYDKNQADRINEAINKRK